MKVWEKIMLYPIGLCYWIADSAKKTGNFIGRKAKPAIAMLVAVTMMLSLMPITAFAATDPSVLVGGVEMYSASGATYYVNGATTAVTTEPNNWNAKYENGILTIKNLSVVGAADYKYKYAGIYATTALTIDAQGANSVTGADCSGVAYGIYIAGALTIQGDGALSVTGGTATSGGSFGISTTNGNNISITENVVVNATGGTAGTTNGSIGIDCGGTLLIGGNATVNATGGSAGVTCGIYSDDVRVTGGVTVATGGTASGSALTSYGISISSFGDATVTTTGGVLVARAGSGTTAKAINGTLTTNGTKIAGQVVGSTFTGSPASYDGNATALAIVPSSYTVQNTKLTEDGVTEYTINTDTAVVVPGSADSDIPLTLSSAGGTVTLTEDLVLINLQGKNYTPALELGGASNRAVTVNGSGTLTAIGAANKDYSYGIVGLYRGGFSVNGAKVIAIGGAASNKSYGIGYSVNVKVSSGSVVAIGGSASGSSYGISATTTVNGGTLNAIGGKASTNSYGINGRTTANGGTLNAIGGVAADTSYGIYCESILGVSVANEAKVAAVGRTYGLRTASGTLAGGNFAGGSKAISISDNTSNVNALLATGYGYFAGETQLIPADSDATVGEANQTVTVKEAPIPHKHCVCGGTGAAGDHTSCEDITWTEWDGTGTFPGGNVYLTDDITLTEALTISGAVNLCLNGHKVSAEGGYFEVSGTLNLCSCEDNGIIKRTTTTNALISADAGATANLYNVTLDGGAVWGGTTDTILLRGTNNSGIVSSSPLIDAGYQRTAGGHITLNSGVILQNNECSDAGDGGAVTIGEDGTLVINGATICNNAKTDGNAGAIKAYAGAQITLNSGEIYGNEAYKHGGAIQIFGGDSTDYADAVLTMNGSTIRNNKADGVGGGVAVSDYSSFTMNGGTIKDNATTDYSKRGGGVGFADANTEMAISGNAVITDNAANSTANNLYIGTNSCNTVTVGEMKNGANIGVTMKSSSGGVFTNGGADYVDKEYFTSDKPAYIVAADGNNLKLTIPHTHSYTYAVNGENAAQVIESCTCGHTGTATISATDAIYDGLEHNTATVDYSEGWKGGELTISYANNTNAGTATASITIEGKTASVKFTIEKATPTAEDFIFTAPTDLIYDGTAKPATITVKDGIVGMGEVNVIYFRDAGMWIDNEREPIYPGRYKVGIWIKEGDNYKAVYSDERIWLGSEFEIKYLTTDAKADISGTMGSNGWYTSDVTLTAPEGYQISKTKYNDGFESKLTISAEKNETITYYLKDANGDVAEKTVELKIDKTAPSAQYQIGTNGWKQFINTITFGLFCKDYKTVDIEYTDELSGVAEKQYYISSEEITDTSSIAWLDYTDTLSLNASGKYLIYMRVVDNAGHEVILNTEGIVIYEDSIQVTESVSATYNAGTDKAVTVKLNGNTVNAIKNGNSVLTADTDYTVSADGTITLKASYLDALNAGEYTFTVSYNPQGVETDKVNMTTTFTVKVEKADGKVSNLNISGKTYDGTAVTAPTFDKPGDGAATIEYKVRGADDSTYTTTAPKDAGNYVVRVTVAESTNYKAASATTYFAIASAELRDVSVQQNGKLTYSGQAQTPTVSTSATTVDGSKVTFTYSTEMEGTYGTEIPSFTNAGWAHTVYYRATADNHNTYYGSFHVEIEKATVTEPTIASKPYNGSVQTADITDTELYTVVKNDGGTGVKLNGYYDVVLKLKDSANYKWSTTENAQVTLPFAITRAENEWAVNPSISGWTYGETANEPVGEAKFGADSVEYSGTTNGGAAYSSSVAPTEAGSYKATFTVQETEDYKGLETSVDFTIAKKAVTVTANDASKTYGESDPALTYTHTELVGSDALVITVARTSGENANTYTITASQEDGANPNYEITFKTGIFTIRKAPLTVTVEDKTATYGDPVPTYTVKYEGFKNGDDKDDLGGALAFEYGYAQFSDKGEYTIKASGYTSGNYTISYVDGKLTVNAKPITVTIQNATSVYGDTLAELKSTDNGIVNGDTNVYSLVTTATGTSNVGKYTITGTALDSNYDVTFVNGEYEITKREITITVDVKNTVVNTTLPSYTYKVEGLVGVDTLVTEPTITCNANIALIGEYDITASGADAGGNYSIKYVPAKLTVLTDNAVDAAAGYTEELKDYDPATVTSEDKAELEEMLSEINTILADETTTDNGKKALEEVKEQVEKLIKEINDAAEATDTENTEKVENVTPENVIPENKTDLEGAKADLEKALEDNGGNYTEDEKKAIEDEIKRIDDALEVIGNVEAVEDLIDKLPENITKNDEDAIKAADDAYNALSDYEKSLVDEGAKKALTDAKAALAELNKPAEPNSPATRDNSNMFLWIALLFISGGAVITLTVVDRKKRMASNR